MPRIKTTITIPESWFISIRKYMEIKGYSDYAEFFKALLREKMPEIEREVTSYESKRAELAAPAN